MSDLYPKELEQGCCMNTRDRHEYDTFNPDQIISVPSDRNADGLVDIIMSTREGKVIRCTEVDDRNAWDDTSHYMELGRLFPWEELPREATKGRVLEFVADIANKHNLSLVELTVFPMAVNHKSLTVRTSVCNMWSMYLDKVNQKESYPVSQECLQIFNCLISQYLNGVGELESYAIHPTKKARVGKASLVPKSVFIESSIHSSMDDTASSNASITELPEVGQRTLKNGYIVIDLKSIFDTAFPNVKIRPISRVIHVGNKKPIKIWQATGTRVNRGEKMMLYPGHMPTMPKSYLTLEDHSTWYYNKAVAVGALMWYNLTTVANTDWRNRWFRHLLGNESEVSLRRSKFPKEDALVRLFISRKSKSNKKRFVLSYPDD